MALILASFGKGFVFLMMIWDYDEKFSNFSVIIDIFIFTSNVLACKGKPYVHAMADSIEVFLDVHTLKAASVVLIGMAVKMLFQVIMYAFFHDVLKILCILNFCIAAST
jgi:hypothetical protein